MAPACLFVTLALAEGCHFFVQLDYMNVTCEWTCDCGRLDNCTGLHKWTGRFSHWLMDRLAYGWLAYGSWLMDSWLAIQCIWLCHATYIFVSRFNTKGPPRFVPLHVSNPLQGLQALVLVYLVSPHVRTSLRPSVTNSTHDCSSIVLVQRPNCKATVPT